MNKESKLKPCPFCGHGDINVTVKDSNTLFDNARIWCDRCGASATGMTEEKASERWNRRISNNKYDATEIAFKNAYKKAVEDIFEKIDILVDEWKHSRIQGIQFIVEVAVLKNKYIGDKQRKEDEK